MCVSFGEIAVCLQVTQRFKIKCCISVSLFSNFGFFVTFLNLKSPSLITLSQELSIKLRKREKFVYFSVRY